MTSDDFRKSLAGTEPPAGIVLALAGLWWDANGDWKRAQARKKRRKILLNVIPSRKEHVKLSL